MMKLSPISKLPKNLRDSYGNWNVSDRLTRFDNWLARNDKSKAQSAPYDHTETVNEYYDLLSEWMQFGWNESLHFAPLTPDETLEEAIIRHECLMIEKLDLHEGMKVIDVGCGVGGPLRRVAQETGLKLLGINNNDQQLEKARRMTKEAGLDHLAEFRKCNFMDMSSIEPESFDAGYAIESTCYAPDKARAFAQIFRVLKPGALFWGQEMCLTNKFKVDDEQHCVIRDEIKHTLALSEFFTFAEVNHALESVGFELIEARDREIKDGPSTPWYQPMEGLSPSLRAWRRIPFGRNVFVVGVRLAEIVGIFPKDASKVVGLANRISRAYVAGGQSGIYTPLYCFLARKPTIG